jgi:hypothetical protein
MDTDMEMIVEQCVVLVEKEDGTYSLLDTIFWLSNLLFQLWPGEITILRGTFERHFYEKLRSKKHLVRTSLISSANCRRTTKLIKSGKRYIPLRRTDTF